MGGNDKKAAQEGTKGLNELQAKENELLKFFLDICNQLDLTYFLVCGSALGAVKYKGFVPWDDDVDVALPRPDYERFLSEAPALLPEWVFVQNYRTDPEYPGVGSKLRNCNTTFIEEEASKINMNHGVYIDIFPLDGYPQDEAEQERFEKLKWKHYRKRYTALIPFYHRDWGLTVRSALRKFLGIYSSTNKACRAADDLMQSNDVMHSKIWCNFANSMRKSEYFPAEVYGKGAWMEFEGTPVRVPEQYDTYLRQKYGDYSKDPPAEKQVASHGQTVDLTKPYTHYFKKG